MKNARFRQTRQSDSRERSAFHHDLTGDADGLVVSGSQGRAQHERWQSHHAFTDFAQTRIGGGDEGNSGSSANELRPDGEGALSLSGVSAGVGANCESGKEMTVFVMFAPANPSCGGSSAVETSLIIFSDKSKRFLGPSRTGVSLGMTRSGKKIKFYAKA